MEFHFVLNPSENGKYNLIWVDWTRIRSMFLTRPVYSKRRLAFMRRGVGIIPSGSTLSRPLIVMNCDHLIGGRRLGKGSHGKGSPFPFKFNEIWSWRQFSFDFEREWESIFRSVGTEFFLWMLFGHLAVLNGSWKGSFELIFKWRKLTREAYQEFKKFWVS